MRAACLCALALFLPAGTPADWKLAAPKPVADERPLENEKWRELACAGCHEDVTLEWARSTHATAWIDPRYQEALQDKRKPEACHNCHIPEPLSGVEPGLKPKAREAKSPAWTQMGVDCNACHLGREGEILGPVGAANSAHASAKSTAFLPEGESQLCVSCHATNVGPVIGIARDFVETRQWEKQKSCVGCHMQALEREFVRGPGLQPQAGGAPYPKRAGRSHELQTARDPAFLARAFELRAREEQGEAVLELANVCGHRVPGLIGRTLEFEAELLDAAGTVLARAALSIDHESHVPVDESAWIRLGKPGARLRVKGLHEAPGFAKKVLFLETELPVAR